MLKINEKYNKIDIESLKEPIKKAKVIALGTLISVNLYSGITVEKTYSETKDSYSTERSILDIPQYYKTQIKKQSNTFDTENIKSLKLEIDSKDSLEFLKEFYNLKDLTLVFNTPNDYVLDTVPQISSLENLTIEAREDLEISEKVNNLLFENNKDNLKNLSLDGIIIGPNVIENIPGLDTLKLSTSLSNDLDYSKLKIDTLDISSYGAYDIPIFLSRKDYINLIDNDVNIKFSDNELTYLEILDRLDSIIESLNLENKTETEKIDSVVCYILDNLKYDEEVSEALEYGADVTALIERKGFYDEGNLKGALDYETQICGNYTALCKALLKELNIKSFYTLSEIHAWNLIEVENEPYYIDLTYLDVSEKNASERIKKDEVIDLDWYMENPKDVAIMDDSNKYEPVVYPKYFESEENENKENEPYKSKKDVINNGNKDNNIVNIIINNKKYKVPFAVLVGILVALGIAIPTRRKRKKVKKIENKKQRVKIKEKNKKDANYSNECNYYDHLFKDRK